MIMKKTKKYYFSVEGETGRWYLLWLQNLINNQVDATCRVVFYCPVQKDPVKNVKKTVFTGKTEIWHIFDRKGIETEHTLNFKKNLRTIKESRENR